MSATTPPTKTGLLARLTRAIAAHPWRAIGMWVLIIAGIFAAAGTIGGQLQNKFTIPNSDAQKATDQSRFTAYDSAIATQKAQANLEYRNAQDANVQLMAERDQLRNTLEKARAQNQTATDDLRRRLAGERLRFAAALVVAEPDTPPSAYTSTSARRLNRKV